MSGAGSAAHAASVDAEIRAVGAQVASAEDAVAFGDICPFTVSECSDVSAFERQGPLCDTDCCDQVLDGGDRIDRFYETALQFAHIHSPLAWR